MQNGLTLLAEDVKIIFEDVQEVYKVINIRTFSEYMGNLEKVRINLLENSSNRTGRRSTRRSRMSH